MEAEPFNTQVMTKQEFKKLIGKRLKMFRKTAGKTQEQIAEGAEISGKYLSRVELGLENPTIDTYIKIASSLKVDPTELFEVEMEDTPVKLREEVKGLLKNATLDKLKTSVKLLRTILH